MRAEVRAPLYPNTLGAEFALQAGKVQNLRVALAQLHGVTIPAGEVFSFWAHVGRPTRRAGFVPGRELREGCVVPSVGGGLCNLSNTLYDAALRAGFEIVERHAHSRRLPGSMAAVGRDATVFWNHVDLRFRAPPGGCRIEAWLTRAELVVRFRAVDTAGPAASAAAPAGSPPKPRCREAPLWKAARPAGWSPASRHPEREGRVTGGVTAWLVDARWPEFDRFLRDSHAAGDHLFLPLHGRGLRRPAYAWNAEGYARVHHAPLQTLHRAWVSRRLAAQGAARQRALLRFDAALAARYARGLPSEATHLVVSQNLLPFLWLAGTLGGRTFDVLMTRLPLAVLQETLDRAAARHPGSPTLADFRADPALAEAESAALAEAARWITPITPSPGLRAAARTGFPGNSPRPDRHRTRRRGAEAILYPASTLGRKGAYELRAVARELGCGCGWAARCSKGRISGGAWTSCRRTRPIWQACPPSCCPPGSSISPGGCSRPCGGRAGDRQRGVRIGRRARHHDGSDRRRGSPARGRRGMPLDRARAARGLVAFRPIQSPAVAGLPVSGGGGGTANVPRRAAGGTGSAPEPPHGAQRASRFAPSHRPRQVPCAASASRQ